MFDKLQELEDKYITLTDRINAPETIADQNLWRSLMKEHSDLTPIIEAFREHKKAKQEIADGKEMLEDNIDDDFRTLVKEELKENQTKLEELEEKLKVLLLPKDPNDDKNVIIEIRGGAGGDEAALFAGALFRMYSRYAERNRFKTEILSLNESDLGGVKEISFLVNGKGAYSRLKYESGVHRV